MKTRKGPQRVNAARAQGPPAAGRASAVAPVPAPGPQVWGSSPLLQALRSGWNWLKSSSRLRVLQPKVRRLRVSETVSLGEKRFVSIVEVDGTSFLIGGGVSGVTLLTTLPEKTASTGFQGAIHEAWQARETA